MKLQNKKGFTLIELLVVITIIGILATGATATYTSQIQKARDTTRINDIKALQWAVEQVYQDTGEYPHPDQFNTGASINVSTYLPKLPRDPKNGQTCNQWTKPSPVACVYSYAVGQDDNNINYGAYILSTGFESKWKVDSDGKRDGWTHDWRWEAWNGMMRVTKSKLASDPGAWVNEKCLAAGISGTNSTISWIKGENCEDTLPSGTGDSIITIHGSGN